MKTVSRNSGFTLLELMITVAIVAILATVAVESYISSVRRSGRADARAALLGVQVAQEKVFLQYNRYAKDDTELQADPGANPGLKTSTTVSGGRYTLSMSSPSNANDGSDFKITATAIGSQTKDTDCQSFSIDNLGKKDAKNSANATNMSCWSR